MYFKPIDTLDEIDNMILAILSDDGRASYSFIGEKVGISRVAVKKRIEELEKSGFIGGYKALINQTADENSIRFFMDIEVAPDKYVQALDYLSLFKACRQIYSCTSINRIHVTGFTPNSETLNGFVASLYKNIQGIMKVDFQIITAIYKDSDGGIAYVRHSENEYLEKYTGYSK